MNILKQVFCCEFGRVTGRNLPGRAMPGLSAFGASRIPKLPSFRLCCIRQCQFTLPHVHANTCRKCLRTRFHLCESSRGAVIAHCGVFYVCFVCVCVYLFMCLCECVYMFICLCVYIPVQVPLCVCTCSCASVCVHVHVPLSVHVCTCSCASVCIHVHVPVCTHVETKDQFLVSSSVNRL